MSSHRSYTSERHLRWNPDIIEDETSNKRKSLSWHTRKPTSKHNGKPKSANAVNRNEPPYSVGLWSLHPTNNIRGIILRNQHPIESVRPFGVYQTHKDTMRSLKSLEKDELLRHYNFMSTTPDDTPGPSNTKQTKPRKSAQTLEKHQHISESSDTEPVMVGSLNHQQRNRRKKEDNKDDRTVSILHKDGINSMKTKHINPKRHMTELRFAVERLSGFIGRKRTGVFQTTIEKVCVVVNSIFDEKTDIKLPFRLHRLQYNGFYEIHGVRSIEMYMLPSTIDTEPLEVAFHEEEGALMADVFVHGQLNGLDHFCVKNKRAITKRLSACKLMIFLTHFIETTIKKRYDRRGRVKQGRPPTPYGAFIFNTSPNETHASLRIKFPDDTYSYEITLTLALNFPHSFPLTEMSMKQRRWPETDVLESVKAQGVHILAKIGNDPDVHLWTVSFLKARRKLLQLTDETGNKLRLLLALQALRETQLSRPKLLLPVHLTTVMFWASVKYPSAEDWKSELIAHRFLDVINALRRCMTRSELWDFFVPTLNHFENETKEALTELSEKIKQVVVEPLRYA